MRKPGLRRDVRSTVTVGLNPAFNPSGFNPLASYDDGSCPVVYSGCTDPASLNFRSIANQDDGSCRYAGCMHSAAINYDPLATLPAQCMLVRPGCMY